MSERRRRQGKLRWYIKRARMMSARELLHRARRQCDTTILQAMWRYKRGIARPKSLDPAGFDFCAVREARLPALAWDFSAGAEEIEERLEGVSPALGFPWRWRESATIWREAPDSGNVWPDGFFGAIAYRPGNAHGDARVVWEPARLQQLVTLALVAKNGTADQAGRAVSLLERQLLSWVDLNPPLSGIHYVSAMECALRIIAVMHAVDLARGRLPKDSRVWRVLPAMVRRHARLIERRLSLHSSLGNHTIAECAGLVYAGMLFPELPQARRWRATGLSLLAREADRQVLDDGGGIEQSFWYHAFVLDLCGLVCALLEANDEPVPPRLSAAVDRGRKFLAAFADNPGALPDIGDRDGGYALSPYLRISWLGQAKPQPVETFPTSGYSRFSLGEDAHSYLLFDHGTLGMAPGFGHGHADALSLLFYHRGRPILVDPGTYGYGLEPVWRAYFRGTGAHNTIAVDGRDQAFQESRFQWSAPYRSVLVECRGAGGASVLALARHDGYAALGVTHWRGLFLRPGVGFVVWDLVDGRGEHEISGYWHCNDKPRPAKPEGAYQLHDRITLQISGAEAGLHEAATAPMSGWRAPAYGVKQAITTIRATTQTSLPHTLLTRVRLDSAFGPLEGEAGALAELAGWAADA